MSIQHPLTFLDLCQRTQQECGISGSVMSTVSGASGESLRIVSWVSSAWLEIAANHQDYLFFRGSVSFTSDTTKSVYKIIDSGFTDAANFSQWLPQTFRVYLTSAGVNNETFLDVIDYETWRNQYLFSSFRSLRSRPQHIAVAPDNSLCFGPIADTGYTFVGDANVAPKPLVNDSDTPKSVCAATGIGGVQAHIPTFWNMMVVYKAMMSYGAYENAAEVYNHAERQYLMLVRKLINDQTPPISLNGALA